MEQSTAYRVNLVLGHGVFIALFVLAWQHADLRTTTGDSAYQIFRWINFPGWNVEAHRYTAVLPQAMVKLFKLFGSDLHTLLLVASVAHVLVPYAIFCLCAHVWKARRTAVAVALAAVLCTRLTFYGPVLEANYLLSFPFLLFGFLERTDGAIKGINSSLGVFASVLITVVVHPLGALVLIGGLGISWACKRIAARPAIFLSAMVVLIWLAFRFLFPPTEYEAGLIAKLMGGSISNGSGEWASWQFLVGHTFTLTTNYLPALLVWVATITTLLVLRRTIAACMILLIVSGFLLLCLVTFRTGDSAIMMDRAFLPVAALISLPIGFLVKESTGRWNILVPAALALVLFVKIRDVSFGSRALAQEQERRSALVDDLRRNQVQKAVIRHEDIQARGIDGDWALPCSILLMSALQGNEGVCTVLVAQDEQQDACISSGDLHILDKSIPIILLDDRYFPLPAGPYVRFH